MISPHDLAIAIAGSGGARVPTPEQQAVITAGLDPTLVVAGAGSGKTETMSMRVLWLLANGLAKPGEILGLTFTKKAAAELQERVALRIEQLVAAGLLDAELTESERPTVSTYNAYANQIFREHALVIGRDPEAELLADTAAWVLARDVALESNDPRLAEIGSADQVATYLRTLSNGLGDNALEPESIGDVAAAFRRVAELPDADPMERLASNAKPRSAIDDVLPVVESLEPLIALARQFDDRKRSLGVVEYSDQVRFALQVIQQAPAIAAEHRSRAKFVLLDEYQDTSVVQVRLLSALFRGSPVMAVGDPNQSIYGWRGASAGTLQRFHRDFGDGERRTLSISWRNPTVVLDVANAVAEPLGERGVDKLQARPGAPEGEARTAVFDTQTEEADAIAEWLLEHRSRNSEASAAVLFRARARMPVFADALGRAGIPHRIVGIGGLLGEPEIVDLLAALRVIAIPDAANDLLRLLAGGRWRVGVRDLRALRSHARWMATVWIDDEVAAAERRSTERDAQQSLVDALDHLADRPAEHWHGFSERGIARLRDAAYTFRTLRRSASLPLVDLVRLVERTLRLDIEVAANPVRARRHSLDAFAGHVEAFASVDATGSLASMLRWLDFAVRQDELAGPPEDPEPGVVQLLTVHAAKGLEWDLVAIPSLAEQTMPSKAQDAKGWLRKGELPFAYRGDADALPALDAAASTSAADFKRRKEAFEQALRDRHFQEERRLAYVAVTRAAGPLWLSSAFWVGSNVRKATPSRFLEECADVLGVELPGEPQMTDNPGNPHRHDIAWPTDPLGTRRRAVEAAAEEVRRAEPSLAETAPELALLLAERQVGAQPARVPDRVSASRMKDWLRDPVEVAQSIRRPMPERPFRATRLGTLFHEWVEARAATAGLGDAVDDAYDEVHDDLIGVDAERLAKLRATFLASKYGTPLPIATELEIHLPLAGTTIVCKIDAVYRDGDGFTVVDWKTGKLPTSADDLADRQLQLALYREAYAAHAGVPSERVGAELYFVEYDEVLAADSLLTRAELEQRWLGAQARAS